MDSIIKPRNKVTINNALKAAIPNINIGLANSAKGGLKRDGLLTSDQIGTLMKKIKGNISTQMNAFPKQFKAGFCPNKSCDKYDAGIKKELLKWP